MRTIELSLGKYDCESTLFNIISIDLGIDSRIGSLEMLADFLRANGGYFVNIRYREKLYGNAAAAFAKVIDLFDQIKAERGPDYLDYTFVPREKVVLDFTHCKTICSIYQEMRSKMEWMDWYGENLDALWDILTGLPYRGDDFTILRPKHYRDIPYGQDAEFTDDVDQICEVFISAQQEYSDIKVEIHFSENT